MFIQKVTPPPEKITSEQVDQIKEDLFFDEIELELQRLEILETLNSLS